MEGSGPGRGPGRAVPRLLGLGARGGRPATSSRLCAQRPAPASAPLHPCPWASLSDALAQGRNQAEPTVTVPEKIQSREPSGSRAAEKPSGWRPRGCVGGVRLQCAFPRHELRRLLSSNGGETASPPPAPCSHRGARVPTGRPRTAGPEPCVCALGLPATRRGRGPGLSLRPAAEAPSSAAGPRGRGLEGSLGLLRAAQATCSPSPSRRPLPPPSQRPRRWRSGKGGGQTDGGGLEPQLGSRGSPGPRGSPRTWRKGRRGDGDSAGKGRGRGVRRDSLSFRVAQGDLFPGEPPTHQLPTSRTKGLGSTVGVGERRWREAGRQAVGAGEGAPQRFLSRQNDGKLPPANASLRPLQNPGRLGFLT